jgi:hypothetical protein
MKSQRRFSRFFILIPIVAAFVAFPSAARPQAPAPAGAQQSAPSDEARILQAMHGISSHALLGYVQELVAEKYGGRLTGTPEYDACANWVAGLFRDWGLKPAGDNGTYFQSFPDPYTLVLPDGEVSLNIPQPKSKDVIKKSYAYEDEFIPGGTSGTGEVTAEVVYVGFGITAPELGFDEYRGLDVKGKIVLLEPEVPYGPDKDPEIFRKWRPYSFHQYKLRNAADHGAKGMLYNYGPICNPNSAFLEGFVYAHVGAAVMKDVFAGTGKTHPENLKAIRETLKPRSFATGKVFTLRTSSVHHPEGVGRNVMAVVEGTDHVLKDEYIILGGHLDHVGKCWKLMPGANDNATAVAVTLGVAEAMAKCPVKPKRSVMFLLFGAEEQAVAGSDYYVNKRPAVPLEKTTIYINMEGAGSGDKLQVLAGKNFPKFQEFLEKANAKYIHRTLTASPFANLARPRQDVTWFLWKGVPGVTVGSSGYDAGRPTYHNTYDNLGLVTPEIMEDLAQLFFVALLDMGDEPTLDFRK